MKYYVYIYEDPITNKPFYIGKGSNDRAYIHLKETYSNTENKKKYAYIKGLRNKNLEPIIKFYEYFDREQEAYDVEAALIKKYGRKDINPGGILTNICVDNRPPQMTKVRKKKISDFRKGKPLSAEHRRKLSESHKGKYHLEETKKKISESLKGIKRGPYLKKKTIESHKGKGGPNVGRN